MAETWGHAPALAFEGFFFLLARNQGINRNRNYIGLESERVKNFWQIRKWKEKQKKVDHVTESECN